MYFFHLRRPPIMRLETVNRPHVLAQCKLDNFRRLSTGMFLICNLLSVFSSFAFDVPSLVKCEYEYVISYNTVGSELCLHTNWTPITKCHYYTPPPKRGIKQCCCLTSDVWRRLSHTSWIFMAPIATGSKTCWAPQSQAQGVYELELGRSVRRTDVGAYRGGFPATACFQSRTDLLLNKIWSIALRPADLWWAITLFMCKYYFVIC